MPDSTIRPGPPIPPSLAGTSHVGEAGAVSAEPRRTRTSAPAAVRSRRPAPVEARAGPVGPDVQRMALTVLVTLLMIGAVWLDRDRHAPVIGYGPIPQPGATTVLLDSGLVIGEPAPNFRLLSTGDEVVELSGRRGQPVVLHFWTTWCLACAANLPVLQDLSGHYGDGLHVVGIDVGEPAGRVDAAADRHGAGYPMLLDRDGSVAAAYGVTTYPVTILIDADGIVRFVQQGSVPLDDVRSQIDALQAGH